VVVCPLNSVLVHRVPWCLTAGEHDDGGRHRSQERRAVENCGAYLSPTVYLIRPDATTIDPWFLAGFLSSSGGGRQAARMASTMGDHIRFEPRRVRVPLLPIETQRAYGEAFRRLWDFARTLRAAHDEGIDFVRDLIDATAASITEATGTERSDLVHGS
jgi:hypothetical protein